jgi:hypothetical protein
MTVFRHRGAEWAIQRCNITLSELRLQLATYYLTIVVILVNLQLKLQPNAHILSSITILLCLFGPFLRADWKYSLVSEALMVASSTVSH